MTTDNPEVSGWPAALAGSERAATRWTDEQKNAVLDAVWTAATHHETFTTDAVWKILDGQIPVTKGMAGVMTRAKHLGWILPSGEFAISRRGGAHDHAQRLVVWRSMVQRRPS